ncbi:hypothetical protein IVA95_13310 [Bradyrhizobium sp. 157]|uniref:tripartite tricarboxylate transporter substrate-binding protein n=1 Tax=Bradyrhizobium sp. 157 TaxID=2782631 RepID=UPI001FF8BD8C|nr:tripartite tricarboxylate transporter substrate-binding protein [Bradyrhizobium sp. 157]MCK1638551.1 hypothetical protein [Bradyrhizobium sp. 157]
MTPIKCSVRHITVHPHLKRSAKRFRPATFIDRICQGRQFPRPGGNASGALGNIAGRSGSGRNLARLRGKRFGLGGPKRTPEVVIEKLNKEVNVSIADPKFRARLANLGGTTVGGRPADFAKLISDEVKKWSSVVLAANMER